jgi:DNA helicase HerA-like ATPase
MDAVLRVGEVSGVEGRRIHILVDKNKNLSDMFLDGEILRNISVNGYVEIRKGFLSIIGRVEGEKIEEILASSFDDSRGSLNRNRRVLTVALVGYIDSDNAFVGGTRELPLIGNEAFLLPRTKIHIIHSLVREGSPAITIADLEGAEVELEFPVDGLFNSHIAIFGNTGSGKTNTLAALFQEFVKVMRQRNEVLFVANTRFLLFDFNGEYTGAECITGTKKVYSLSTRNDQGDRLPIKEDALLDLEVLSILADATDKTQKPFLRRALRLLQQIRAAADPQQYVKAILRNKVKDTLRMSDKVRAFQVIDYFREILPETDAIGNEVDFMSDLDWHNQSQEFRLKQGNQIYYLAQTPNHIVDTAMYEHVEAFEFEGSIISRLIVALYIQLVTDVLTNRAQNEHVAPVINRLKSKRPDIDKLFDLTDAEDLWQSNFVVVNLRNVNLEMRKTIPLLLSKKVYAEHKLLGEGHSLNLIIDEAHNILSRESFREAESWKDYRLETFEEIIKEGRKFGVFVTIASQRPSDISPTITSQAHNYFIHRLINQRDLETIASAVSYIDKVTAESIPTLPTGTCIFSGVAGQMPLKINVRQLSPGARPLSSTRQFRNLVPAAA